MKKYLAEGIGTFFLVFVIILTTNDGIGSLAPLAAGATLAALMYASWHISGAHFNPAVTLAMLMRAKIYRTDALYYVVAQIAGAVLASFFGVFLVSCSGEVRIASHLNNNGLCSIIAEFLGTFGLVYVFLNVVSARGNLGNSFYGLAVGLAFAGAGWALGSISGGMFNPALALGATIAGMLDFGDFWIYLLGACMGAAAAASAFQVLEQ